MKENPVKEKTYTFAVRIVKLCRYLANSKKEYVISKQLIRSGTAPGALVREAEHGESKDDFIHKMSIALKEANETGYWLQLLYDTGFLSTEESNSIKADCDEIVRLLVSIIKTSKAGSKK